MSGYANRNANASSSIKPFVSVSQALVQPRHLAVAVNALQLQMSGKDSKGLIFIRFKLLAWVLLLMLGGRNGMDA